VTSFRAIVGVVRDEAGEPAEHARVYFTGGPEPFPDVAALTGSDGRFSLTAPSEGTYTVECKAEGVRPVSTTVDVGSKEAATIELRLERGD
jgi:carboxypeptidase family protein